MSVKVGDVAPDFKLKSNAMEDVSLSDFKGKKNVVVLFFPFVNSGTCEKELCNMRDNMAQYEELDAQILAISVDSYFAQKLWGEIQRFNFPLLSDFNKEVCQAYGAYFDVFVPGKFDYKGVAKRSAFVVDKEGVVRYAEILENPGDEPSYDGIKETLAKLN